MISAGHLIRRKGILDFLETARRMPDVLFLWFGGGNHALIPEEIKRAVAEKPENVIFAGFVPSIILRDAYSGADAFAFSAMKRRKELWYWKHCPVRSR